VWVLMHEIDLFTLVKNLVDNAVRYTPTGGRVDLSVDIESNKARLRVKDSGPGIALQERERVFDPFYRSLGNEQVGSGLGLSIVRAITERARVRIDLGFTDELRQSGLCVSVWLTPDGPGHTSKLP
jgi:two-component system OmpR family sensor kinase